MAIVCEEGNQLGEFRNHLRQLASPEAPRAMELGKINAKVHPITGHDGP